MTEVELGLLIYEDLHTAHFAAGVTPEETGWEVDTDLIAEIVEYLAGEEELLADLTEDNQADRIRDVLLAARFIYGYSQWLMTR